MTPFRTDDFAPYLLSSFDSDRYFPYESDPGLLKYFAAFCMPELLATRPIWSVSLAPVDAPPAFLRPLMGDGPVVHARLGRICSRGKADHRRKQRHDDPWDRLE